MKALLVCLTAVILEAAGCGDGSSTADCPPCPECPPAGQVDDGRVLDPMPQAREMIDQYKTPATRYTDVSAMVMNVDDLQTLVNMARRDGRRNVHLFLGSFTDKAAREYLAANGLNVEEYLQTTVGKPVVLMGTTPDNVLAVKTKICPPPNTCGMDWDR